MDETNNDHSAETLLPKMAPHLPKPVRFPLLSSLRHFELAESLFDTDREMASFRAITGEKEAATALMLATQLRKYEGANIFRPHDHRDKAAVLACSMAIAKSAEPILKNFHLTFNWKLGRIDLLLPLSNFGIAGGDKKVLQPVEPLDLLHVGPGKSSEDAVDQLLADLAHEVESGGIEKFIRSIANARNRLLYASNNRIPFSEATPAMLQNRKTRGLILLVATVIVMQTQKQQALVSQSVKALARIVPTLRGGRAKI